MNNEELGKWNASIEEARAAKLNAMERAVRSRGLQRRINLMFARWFEALAKMGARWRDMEINDD